jgi:hypothetical protein
MTKFYYRSGDYHNEIDALKELLQGIEEDMSDHLDDLDLSNYDGDRTSAENLIELAHEKIEELVEILAEFDNWVK